MLSVKSDQGQFLSKEKLIIWEEIPMANKAAIECADMFLRLLEDEDEPFGRKIFLGLGDFRQAVPVVKGCGPTATYEASIQSSILWKNLDLLRLNMAA